MSGGLGVELCSLTSGVAFPAVRRRPPYDEGTGVVMFLVPRHVKSCHRRCAYGSRYPHTCQYSIYVCSFFLVYIAYRTGTQVFTHTLALHGS